MSVKLSVSGDLYAFLFASPSSSHGISVTVSIGVAAYGMHGTQRNQLIEKADQAMYQAKLDGRNCVRLAVVAPSPNPMRSCGGSSIPLRAEDSSPSSGDMDL